MTKEELQSRSYKNLQVKELIQVAPNDKSYVDESYVDEFLRWAGKAEMKYLEETPPRLRMNYIKDQVDYWHDI